MYLFYAQHAVYKLCNKSTTCLQLLYVRLDKQKLLELWLKQQILQLQTSITSTKQQNIGVLSLRPVVFRKRVCGPVHESQNVYLLCISTYGRAQ